MRILDFDINDLPPKRPEPCLVKYGDWYGRCGDCLWCRVECFESVPLVNFYGVREQKDEVTLWRKSHEAAQARRARRLAKKPAKPQERFALLEVD